jgi:transcriptional regulator with XRE-family HTH domain
MEIGIKISQARREQGITQVELAEKMSVTRQTVSRWESGVAYPDIEKVVNLAEILHTSCDYLLTTKDNRKKEDSFEENDGNQTSSTTVTRLLATLEGKKVRISFYDDEEDMDILNEICKVEGFEGNWIRVIIMNKKKERKKIIALSSILTFEIVNVED